MAVAGQLERLRLMRAMVPAEVIKRIDAEELADRLAEAARMLEQSRQATSPTVAKALGESARDLLAAQPREVTERQVSALLVKAQQARNADERDGYRANAERIKAANPVAPRRRVSLNKALPTSSGTAGGAKQRGKITASKADMVPVFDANGTLVGVCDPTKIVPVMDPAEFAKSRRRPA